MNPQEQQQLKIMYSQLSAYYGRQLQDFVIDMYVQDLMDIPFEKIKLAMSTYRRNPKNKHLPLPADLRAEANPGSDPDTNAREAASRVVAAVSKFGYTNPKDAEAFIGSLGWHVVKRYGWLYICENLGTHHLDLTTFTAHVRDQAKTTILRGPEGATNAPSLPQSDKVASLLQGNDMNKMLERK